MKAAFLALLALLKPPFVRLLSSMKFWTFVLGVATTQAAKYGFEVDEKTYWTLVGGFSLLLTGQALTDHGKEAARSKQGGFARLPLMLSMTLAGLLLANVACGASARETALRTTFVATSSAQAGFVAWDKEHQLEIARAAPSQAEGLAELARYHEKRSPVLVAFEATYRTLAAAAILNEDGKSLATAIGAFEQLRLALSTLTGGKLP